jgi:hypothetical protein
MKGPIAGLCSIAALAAIATPCALSEDSDAEIAKKLNNPVASMISVPFQLNWDFNMGALNEGTQFKLNFQPVIPVSLNDEWNLIIRTIVPYISQEDVLTGPRPKFPGLPNDVLSGLGAGARAELNRAAERAFNREVRNRPIDRHQDGLSDITQSFFFAPKEPIGGWIIGAGPVFLYPTATDDLIGSEKWCAGPTLLMLRQEGGWTYGFLANHLWSFAGDESRSDINATFVQPFVSYTTKAHTTFGVNTEATYDWNTSQWTVPINGFVTQLVRIGKLPVSFSLGGRYYAEGPSGAPEWGVRFVVTPVFPTGGSPPPSGGHFK